MSKQELKPLVWVDEWKNGSRFLADWGVTPITLASDGTYYWAGGNYETVQDAKDAAQADFERRVRSLFVDTVDRRETALVEALKGLVWVYEECLNNHDCGEEYEKYLQARAALKQVEG